MSACYLLALFLFYLVKSKQTLLIVQMLASRAWERDGLISSFAAFGLRVGLWGQQMCLAAFIIAYDY